jgi:hypothetical protein
MLPTTQSCLKKQKTVILFETSRPAKKSGAMDPKGVGSRVVGVTNGMLKQVPAAARQKLPYHQGGSFLVR